MVKGIPKVSDRAERFAIHLPVRYREPHSPGWFEGETENISSSGVLFRTDGPLRPKTTVEMRLALPVAIKDEGPCEIVCKGAIVRMEQNAMRGTPLALAVAIQHYRFARARQLNYCGWISGA
jgi:hypothetical protein